MKKLSIFAVALALTALVACNSKKEKEPAPEDGGEDLTEQVQEGASETLTAAEETTTGSAEMGEVAGTENTEAAQ